MHKITTFFKKINKIIRMMHLYGVEPIICGHLEGLSYRLFGKDCWFIRKRHKMVLNNLMPCYEDIKDKFLSVEQTASISPESKIWVMWWQGINNYPDSVKVAINNIKRHKGSHDVIELSKDNISQYIDIPEDIQDMFAKNKISVTHYSDIIRFTLLSKYGGVWMDSTMMPVRSFPDDFYQHKLYTIRRKSVHNSYISAGRWTTFFIACGPNNILSRFCRDFLIQYWRRYNRLIDYTILDYAIHIGYENIPEIRDLIDSIEYNNTNTSCLISMLNKPFDEEVFQDMCKDTFLFKLSWKEKYQKKVNGKDTFFGHICREDLL